MSKLISKLFPLIAMLVLFTAPVVVQAETTCTCFCRTEGGAVQASETKVILDKCESLCDKSDSDFLSCAKTAREFPGNNALCFSAADCAKVKGTLATPQPPECPSDMKYCFPSSQKVNVKLNVKIGAMETVGDLGEYVSTAYSWMLGAAAVIAVIFIMIGGLEWVLSAGGASSVTKAKDHIKNGIIGLLLLISVSLILQTVNPELLKMQVPKPSLLRQIVLADGSCEKLISEGYTIETEQSAKKECGTTAVIKKDSTGNAVADGLTCQYTKCADLSKACIGVATNSQCVSCYNVSAGNPSSPAKPSPAVCSMLGVPVYADEITNGKKYLKFASFCSFVKGGLAGVSGLQTSSDITVTQDSCMESRVDCSNIVDCESYDDNVIVYVFDKGQLVSEKLSVANKTQFGLLCSSDPCGVADKSPDITGCHWDSDKDCDNVKKSIWPF